MRVLAVVFIGIVLGQVASAYPTDPVVVRPIPTPSPKPVVLPSLNGTATGTPVCYARYISPVYQEPKYQCPEGFLLGNYHGTTKCIKKTHTCGKGLKLTSDYKCCEECPANCQQKGGYCYAPPSQVCQTQKTPCEPDCEQTLLCPGKGKYGLGSDKKKDTTLVFKEVKDPQYAPVDCVYQCCKTTRPAFPISCSASKVETEWCEPTILCPKGAGLDPESGKCLLHQGGWAKCPAVNGTLCKCGGKPFCTSAKSYFGIEACKMFCDCLDTVKISICDPVSTLPTASPSPSPYPGKLASLGQKIDSKIDAIGDKLAEKAAEKAAAEAEKLAALAEKLADKAAEAADKAAAKADYAATKAASDPIAASTGGKYGKGSTGSGSTASGPGAYKGKGGSATDPSAGKGKGKGKADPKKPKSKYNTADAAALGYGY